MTVTFHSMKNSVLNFRIVSDQWNRINLSGISRKPCKVYPNFQHFLPGISVPLMENNNFQLFWKLYQKMSAPFAPVSKFKEFLVEWKAPKVLFKLIFFEEIHFWCRLTNEVWIQFYQVPGSSLKRHYNWTLKWAPSL